MALAECRTIGARSPSARRLKVAVVGAVPAVEELTVGEMLEASAAELAEEVEGVAGLGVVRLTMKGFKGA